MTSHEKRVEIFGYKQTYLNLKKQWAKRKNHTALEHAVYNILRGYRADRGFSKMTNSNKLENGLFYGSSYWYLFRKLESRDDCSRFKELFSGSHFHIYIDDKEKKKSIINYMIIKRLELVCELCFQNTINTYHLRKAYELHQESISSGKESDG